VNGMMRGPSRLLLATASGLALAAASPPSPAGLLAWAAFVPLFIALEGAGARESFLIGLVSGLVFYLGTVYWVVHSMYYFGGVPLWISVAVMLLLALYLAVYTGLFAFLSRALRPMPVAARMLAVPAVWVALEYMRGTLFTGFPWMLLGYTQTPYLPLIQIAGITGVWGVSYLVMAVNAAVFMYLWPALTGDPVPGRRAAAPVLGLLAFSVAYGLFAMARVDAGATAGKELAVGIAQGSIDQSVKWATGYQDKTVDIYASLSREAAEDGARLIVWPETAMPFFFESNRAGRESVFEVARETGSYILTGSLGYNYNPGSDGPESKGVLYFNSAYLIAPDGRIAGRYDKHHLVPYGEYVPLKRFLPFVKKLTEGAGEFAAGPGAVPLTFEGVSMGVLICYEATFPGLSREFVRNGAGLLVNITNDAWFGRTSAPYQHLAMTRMRAVENRVFIVRSANTGISAVIDPAGRVVERSSLFERTYLKGRVGPGRGRTTIYTALGDFFAYACLAASALAVVLGRKRRK